MPVDLDINFTYFQKMIFKESNNNMSDFAFQMFLKKNDEVKAMQNETKFYETLFLLLNSNMFFSSVC